MSPSFSSSPSSNSATTSVSRYLPPEFLCCPKMLFLKALCFVCCLQYEPVKWTLRSYHCCFLQWCTACKRLTTINKALNIWWFLSEAIIIARDWNLFPSCYGDLQFSASLQHVPMTAPCNYIHSIYFLTACTLILEAVKITSWRNFAQMSLKRLKLKL